MTEWTVKDLARLAGVSIRTLHHYDAIGLLRPENRTASGYRLYGREQLLRLQQILFLRELDVPLEEIATLLDAPGYDPAQALRLHRKTLEERLGRLHRLLNTLDKTVAHYEGEQMLTDEELYVGFTPEEAVAIRREARERWGDAQVEESERRARSMTRAQWSDLEAEVQALNAELAAVQERDFADPAVRKAVARHYTWVTSFWIPDAEAYRGLGRMYRDDPRFAAYYEKIAPGLALYLCEAIERLADDIVAEAGRQPRE